jgi:hypothetical protein
MPLLTGVHLDNCARISNDGVASLASLANLRQLSLSYNCKVTTSGLDAIAHLPLVHFSMYVAIPAFISFGGLIYYPLFSRGVKAIDADIMFLISRFIGLQVLDISESLALAKKGLSVRLPRNKRPRLGF